MSRTIMVAGAFAACTLAGAARADPVIYTWAGVGTNISGNSKCWTYKATMQVTVDGDSVKGLFLHEGRPERRFEAILGKGGTFKTKDAGGQNRMNVEGVIKDAGSKFEIFGYCLFEGKLTRK